MRRFTSDVFLAAIVSVMCACSAGNGAGNGDGSGHGDGATGDATGGGSDVHAMGDVGPKGGDSGSMTDIGIGYDTSSGVDATPIPYDAGIMTLPDGEMVFPDGGAVPDGWTPPMGPDGGTGCVSVEICGDGLDNNCNGVIDEGCACLPGQTEMCFGGVPDQAGVGVCIWGTSTCTDTGEFGSWGPCVGAGSPQPVVCGGMMDYRCDGMIDEGCGCTPGATESCYDGPSGTSGVGLCHAGTSTCVGSGSTAGFGPCVGEVTPTPGLCDGMDHECTGAPDPTCVCVVGTSRACYDGPTGTEGVGLCHGGSQTCVVGGGGLGSMWGTCTGEVTPAANTCDGIDRACNGMPMTGCPCLIGATQACYTGPTATRHVGICRDGTEACVAMGSTAGWSSTCSGETVPDAAEICGNGLDDNCNGAVDEGCGGMLTCPGSQTINAGSPVVLTAAGTLLTSYTWTITSAPTGGASTAVWSPAPPTAMTETFTPYIVGVYTIQVTAVDTVGVSHMCSFNITAQGHGLRVELTWNGTGDLDLHLHNNTTTVAWYTADDCYYGNCQSYGSTTPTLIWVPGVPASDPVLDFDNTTANGPENTRIDTPIIGESYEVSVHNYASGNGRTATIQIFCGGGTVPQATYTHAVSGTAAGNCTANTFWKVANVDFSSATTCTITAINTVEPSSTACTTF